MTWQRGGQGGRSGSPDTSTTPTQFKAPTTGLEDVFFKTNRFKDAAEFIWTKTALARYVGTQNCRETALASWIMDSMTNPTFTAVENTDKPDLKSDDGS